MPVNQEGFNVNKQLAANHLECHGAIKAFLMSPVNHTLTALPTTSSNFNVFSRATLIRLRRDYGGRVASGYLSVREQTKTILEKTTWAASFRRVGWDFRPALLAKSGCADHCRRVARALPVFTASKSIKGYARTTAIRWRNSSSISLGIATVCAISSRTKVW